LLYFALSTENCVGSLIAENEESVAPSLFCKYNNYSGKFFLTKLGNEKSISFSISALAFSYTYRFPSA